MHRHDPRRSPALRHPGKSGTAARLHLRLRSGGARLCRDRAPSDAPRRHRTGRTLGSHGGEATVTEDGGVKPVQDRRISVDSRRVAPGDAFVCLRGAHVDGHDYAAEAVRRGAATVVSEHPLPLPPGVESIVVADAYAALSSLAAAHFGHPSRALRCIGVTGTNGKTTTTYLVQGILAEAGVPCAVFGTLGARFADRSWALENTTPLALDLQELLAEVRAAGARAVVMEVSSHALALHRADDVEFDVAAFTNLTQDHLDFHGTLEAYEAAKRVLFTGLLARSARQPERVKAPGTAVLNADDATARRWLAQAWPVAETLSYGFSAGNTAGVRAEDVDLRGEQTRFLLRHNSATAPVKLSLPGRFNVSNALCAAGCGVALGLDLETIARGLGRLHNVPGRMMPVAPPEGSAGAEALPKVIVDYAHTPDGLANVLDAVRPATLGRVIVVFGAGGDRDRRKRPLMGAAAAERADILYVTSDNPRTEDPRSIIDDVMEGVSSALARGVHCGVSVIVDRAAAIGAAIAAGGSRDVVVIAGKGHEDYQIVGEERRPFSDAVVARAAMEERLR
ncbi:UDP-N-acetylmuramoyl-L-alanyl-D-glutamate--2,6-diaminopimelate ligase [bacterium]|nr:MAG: UDP-N-acetylmuramoyl-L-alanyl-D-glutamate--2,6-diaminopimelate ligase [bacterium]